MSPMQFPQIPSGPAPPVAWDPDDHVWKQVPTLDNPPPVMPYNANNFQVVPLTPVGSWIDVDQMYIDIDKAGTSVCWGKAVFQDTSGTVNTFRLRLTATEPPAPGFSYLDQAMGTVPANGYATLCVGFLQEYTNAPVHLRLEAMSSAAGNVRGYAGDLNNPTNYSILALWLSSQNIGGGP